MNGSNGSELCGVIPVYKPSGWTSFDVIAKLKGILHTRRIGHSGTLDPIATGVLPVFVGKATKACDIIPESDKTYRAGFRLGIATDTQDITGEILKASELSVSTAQLEQVCKGFIGDIMQTPPMYSAVKVNGQKLCDLARKGQTVERKAKLRHISLIDILSYDEQSGVGEMLVSVSKGTYIRTLINDIGDRLGCGGVMTALERTYAGGFDVSQCKTIEQIQKSADNGSLDEILLSVDSMFAVYDAVYLNERNTAMYKNGVKLRTEQVGKKENQQGKILRVYGSDKCFLGLAQTEDNLLKSIKNFY